MTKIVLGLMLLVIAAVLCIHFFWEFLGIFTAFSWLVTGLLLMVGVFFAAKFFYSPKAPAAAKSKKPTQFKVVDNKNPCVYMFRDEPALKDLILIEDQLHLAQLELQGDVIQIDNNTEVIILEDDGKEAIKIKLKSTDKKSKKKKFDQEGWICRSVLSK
jgi:hypothetical protein